jgi:hypothetical protein
MFSASTFQPVSCGIFVNGREMMHLYEQVQEVRVEAKRGQATTCTITLDSQRLESGQWNVQDLNSDLRPMADLRIEARFGTSPPQSVMQGLISEVNLDFPSDMSAAKVTVVGQDYSLLLDRVRLSALFPTELKESGTDADLVSLLLSGTGLQAKAEQGQKLQAFPLKDTAIKILMERAKANGFELYMRDRVLHFHASDLGGTPQDPILVYAGQHTNCLTFSLKHDGHRPQKVTVHYAERTGTEAKEFPATPNYRSLGAEPALHAPMNQPSSSWWLEGASCESESALQAKAQAAANESALGAIVAEGELDGALYGKVLRSMETVTVEGIGSAYASTFYVADVAHTFSAGGYRQRFRLLTHQLGRSPSAVVGGATTQALSAQLR